MKKTSSFYIRFTPMLHLSRPILAGKIAPLVVFIVIQGCSMSNTYLNIMQPGSITIGQNIKTIALVNRTLPENKKANVIEAVLTAEGLLQDKEGTQRALSGLNDMLMESPRFHVKNTNVELQGSGSGNLFPAQLDWGVVSQVCKENNTDGVAALETYDSDCIITNWAKDVEKTVDGKKIKSIEYYYKELVIIKLGFRLYDPNSKTVVDQYPYSFQMDWQTSGSTPEAAIKSMISKRDAMAKASYAAGSDYGRRISPSWVSVGRAYYRKPKGTQFAIGVRKARVNDWKGAAEIWERCINGASEKEAGRAAYNLALALEVNGDLNGAKKWAMKSYSDYGNKKAVQY
ncbi:MAG TPA: DUF6340 family protein, partial [Cytophagaceae bacterium]